MEAWQTMGLVPPYKVVAWQFGLLVFRQSIAFFIQGAKDSVAAPEAKVTFIIDVCIFWEVTPENGKCSAFSKIAIWTFCFAGWYYALGSGCCMTFVAWIFGVRIIFACVLVNDSTMTVCVHTCLHSSITFVWQLNVYSWNNLGSGLGVVKNVGQFPMHRMHLTNDN